MVCISYSGIEIGNYLLMCCLKYKSVHRNRHQIGYYPKSDVYFEATRLKLTIVSIRKMNFDSNFP